MPIQYTFVDPLRIRELTTAQRDGLNAPWGVLILNGDTDLIEMRRRAGGWSGLMTFADHVDREDAWVDNTYTGANTNIYHLLGDAIRVGSKAILLKSANDTAAITVEAADSVQYIVGKDADSTSLPVAMTVSRSEFTLRSVNITNMVDARAHSLTVDGCLLSGGGYITLAPTGGTILYSKILNCRVDTSTATTIFAMSTANTYPVVDNNTIIASASATNEILVSQVGGGTIASDFRITNNKFFGSAPSGYSIQVDSAIYLNKPVIESNQWDLRSNGILDTKISQGIIANNVFSGTGSGTTPVVKLTAPTGVNINTLLTNCQFLGNGRLLEFAGAAGDMDGMVVDHCYFGNGSGGGTVLGYDNVTWIGCTFDCTLDMQSDAGQTFIGCDFTNATIQNVPSDVVYRNCRGEDDRGHYIPVHNTVDLGTVTKRFRDLYLERNADIEGTLNIAGATVASSTLWAMGATALFDTLDVAGATTLSSTLAVKNNATMRGVTPETTNTYALGGSSKVWSIVYTTQVSTNTIAELTPANGVTIDGVTLKDSGADVTSGGTSAITMGSGDYNMCGSVASLPSAGASYKNKMIVLDKSGTPAQDELYICLYDASGPSYSWVKIV